jgi:hypothetical protein
LIVARQKPVHALLHLPQSGLAGREHHQLGAAQIKLRGLGRGENAIVALAGAPRVGPGQASPERSSGFSRAQAHAFAISAYLQRSRCLICLETQDNMPSQNRGVDPIETSSLGRYSTAARKGALVDRFPGTL